MAKAESMRTIFKKIDRPPRVSWDTRKDRERTKNHAAVKKAVQEIAADVWRRIPFIARAAITHPRWSRRRVELFNVATRGHHGALGNRAFTYAFNQVESADKTQIALIGFQVFFDEVIFMGHFTTGARRLGKPPEKPGKS